jgi:PAS domain S-box-containing protein
MSFAVQKFRSFPYPVKILLLAGIYYALGRVGFLFSISRYSVLMVWPPTGVALAALLIGGFELWPGIAAGALLVNLSNGVSLPAAAIIGVGNTLESVIGLYLLRRIDGFQPGLNRLNDVIGFLVLDAAFAAMIGATIGAAALCLAGGLKWADYALIWWVWWLGDAMGALIIAPFLLTWGTTSRIHWRRKKVIEAALLFMILVVVSLLVFATPLATAGFYPLAYLTIPFLIWGAFRFRVREVATGNLLVWIIAAWGTTQHIGPFIRSNVQESLLFAWSFVGTISVTALLLAAAIGERKRSETSLRASQARLQTIIENLPFDVWMCDTDGRYIMQNSASMQMRGNINGKHMAEVARDGDTLAEWHQNHRRVFAGEVLRGESEHVVHGEQHQYYYVISPVHEGNEILGVLGTNIDITDQKRAEAALRESESRFRAIFEGSTLGIAVVSRSGYPVSTNPAIAKMLGYSEAELRQMPFSTYTHPDDVEYDLHLFQQIRAGEVDHFQVDKRYIRKDGKIVWARLNVSALSDSTRQGIVSVVLIEDITERKLAEEALRESEGQFRAIFEWASIGIVVVDKQGFSVSINPAFMQMVGYTEAELRQMRFRDYTHPDDVPKNLDLFQQLMDGKLHHYQYDKRYIRKDGGIVWVRMNVSSYPHREEALAVALIEDITERRRAENALRESQEHNSALLDAQPDMIFVLDKHGVFLDYHAPEKSALYVPPEQFLGKSIYQVMPKSLTESLNDLFTRAIETGEVQIFEYRAPDESHMSFYEARILAFGDDRILVISRDISERKRAEAAIQQLNADLEQRVDERTAELAAANERLTELDRLKSKFIADVSHELRTPLAVLSTRVYLLENGLPEKRAEYLIGLRDQIERLTQFVNTILDLSRLELGKARIEFAPVNLNDVIEQVMAALTPRAEANGLRLNLDCADHLPMVRGEFNQLAQVATNLTANAINYTPNGRIDIRTSATDGRVCLQVQDTGIGIASDDLPHLFERFYRGERAGQSRISGSGLGLSIVKEIVDLHGGEIIVESEVGKGSTFTVSLPVWVDKIP